ncbi:MAG: prolyl oligopeptidase family serine peptidase, partial [Prevotella sp.]|nr:prolyl oligopeptidase family serine peptidase [Prevotella sp.]
MKTYRIIVAAVIALFAQTGNTKAQNAVNIGKNNITLSSRLMTPEALWAMGRIASAEASADGQQIVYQVGYYSVKENKGHQVICVINADGKNNRQLTTAAASETDPTWVNGRIAFLTGGEIWSMERDGSDRRQLSKTDGSVEGFKFSPDGRKVIIIKSMAFNEIIKKNPDDLPLATGRRVTDLMYRHWDHYVETIQHPFIADVNADGTIASTMTDILEGEPYECPMEPFGGIEQLAWSPSSKSIAYTCRKKTGLDYAISTDSDIFLYEVDTKETRNLCKPEGYKPVAVKPTHTMKDQNVNSEENLKNNPGYDTNPQFSPDGKHVAWQSMARDGYEADRNRLCVYTFATGEKTYVTEAFDSNVDAFCWSADSKTLSFIGVWHGCVNAYQTNLNGDVKQLTNDWADYLSIAPANNGNKLLAMRQSLSAPTDIYVITPGKDVKKTKIEQITTENKHITDQLSLGKVQQRWVKTTDGKNMLCWIILPSDFDENKKYPTLLFCEGGPQSPVSQFWSYRWNFQIMAANGYVIVAPNRHGLPGFGSEWNEQVSGDWTGQC